MSGGDALPGKELRVKGLGPHAQKAAIPRAPRCVGDVPLHPASARSQLREAEPHPVLSTGLGHCGGSSVECSLMHWFSFLGGPFDLMCVSVQHVASFGGEWAVAPCHPHTWLL